MIDSVGFSVAAFTERMVTVTTVIARIMATAKAYTHHAIGVR